MNKIGSLHDIFDAKFYSIAYSVDESIALNHFMEKGLLNKTNPNPLFDTAWYLAQRPDVLSAGINPLEHYLAYGATERINPHPIFDSKWYLECHPDVSAMGQNPLIHYLQYGASELWDPHPLFDTKWYLAKYPEVAHGKQNPLMHYILNGTTKGYNPHPLFDTNWYFTQRPDVAEAKSNPLAHYISNGLHEGVDPHPIFSTSWYLKVHKDVAEADQNPLIHYLRYGVAEGWDPHPLFDTKWYLKDQFNVAVSGHNPLIHFLERGTEEGHNPHPLFDIHWYNSQRPDVAASRINPLAHYIQSGSGEDTDPHPWFNSNRYRKLNNLSNIKENLLIHYLNKGWIGTSSPNALFDAEYYNKTNPDVASASVDPFLHWISAGRSEGRNPTPLFDKDYYLSTYPDVAAANIEALEHFMSSGFKELRNPHPLFDTVWYIENNLSGNAAGINPLIHFAEYGATNELDPGPRFSTKKYLDANPTLRDEKVNALAHYTTWGRKLAKEKYISDSRIKMSSRYLAVDDISASAMMGLIEADLTSVTRHFFYKPLNIDILPGLSAAPRLHILMPGLNRRYATGGPNTAYILGCLLAKEGIPVTFVSVDVSPDQDIEPLITHLQSLTDLNIHEMDIEFSDGSNRLTPYLIGSNDVFMATAWWTAQAAKSAAALTNNSRFYYLIQDLENTFYGGSVLHAVSKETYSFNHQPIINTSFLRDQLASEKFGQYESKEFVEKAIVFEPAVDRTFFYPVSGKQSGPRRLLFYARPTMAERNLFGLGVASLKALASNGIFDGDDWEFIGMGEDFEPIPLGGGHILRPAPWLDFAGYAELMRSADVLLSLMFSPHPSYPPLEMVVCGNPVVTTSYGVKSSERLSSLSRNIIAVEPTLKDIIFGLTRALTMRDRGQNAAGFDSALLPRSWTESLSTIIPTLLRELLNDGLTPTSTNKHLRPSKPSCPNPLPNELSLQIVNRRSSFRPTNIDKRLGIIFGDNFVAEIVNDISIQFLAQGVKLEFHDHFNDIHAEPAFKVETYLYRKISGFSFNSIKMNFNTIIDYLKIEYLVLVPSDSHILPDAYRILQASLEQTGKPPLLKFSSPSSRADVINLPIYLVRFDVAERLIIRHGSLNFLSFLHQVEKEWQHGDCSNAINETILIQKSI